MPEMIAPPFNDPVIAARKVQIAEDLWNTRDPERVAAAYTEDSQWRNRAEFFTGRAAIVEFLRRKWNQEQPHGGPLRIRMARRQRQLVSQLRQRAVGIRRERTDAPPRGQHQRPA